MKFVTEEEWRAAIEAADAVLLNALATAQIAMASKNGHGAAVRKRLAGDIARAVILSEPNSDILDGTVQISR